MDTEGLIDHRHLIANRPHPAGADGVIDGLGCLPDPSVQLLVGLHVGAGLELWAAQLVKGRLGHHCPDHPHPFTQGPAVFVGGQIVGQDGGIIKRVQRL